MAVTTVLMTIGVGAVVVAAIGLVMYMSALVRNAYELKVELQTEMAESLKRIEEDVDRKAKWVKRDLVDEIQKSRDALSADIARRLQEAQDAMDQRMAEREEAMRRECGDLARRFEAQRKTTAALEEKLRLLQREHRQLQVLALAGSPPPAADAPDAGEPVAQPEPVVDAV